MTHSGRPQVWFQIPVYRLLMEGLNCGPITEVKRIRISLGIFLHKFDCYMTGGYCERKWKYPSNSSQYRIASVAFLTFEYWQGVEPKTQTPPRAVAERLACSPPTMANRVQAPAGSLPDFRMWEYCRTMPLVGGFSRASPHFPRPFIPALLHSHLNHPLQLSRPRCQEPSKSLHSSLMT
ncbi:hypothetical protein PR048_001396 [Dryococelus australis]|uniref:Uncharacterized protein n=1 Tax=Dryococelus australis TaxID=614101 RepID=A0ABQ9IH94_9NEOP|nr:hypothetical protein PR048_001396 [Dryococelus australis]